MDIRNLKCAVLDACYCGCKGTKISEKRKVKREKMCGPT